MDFCIFSQDYGWSNGQIGEGGVWIIDLDGVAYDLPIRDLRKLITSTMDDMGVWDTTWMKGMIDAYSQANPIESDLMQVLLIDMSLPNEFYKHVKDCVVDPVTFLDAELSDLLQRLEQSEVSKWQALQELGLDTAASVTTPARRKGGRAR
ncbi:MAG: spore coat protein CotS [Firmicutes bacterium]|nr:spore coat protein CotS [Bacillota bacterium]